MLNLSRKTYQEVPETFGPQSFKNHPVTEQRFVKGGYQSFISLSERNVFPMERRSVFMTCSVQDVHYILLEDLETWAPYDRGYLVLNPKSTNENFYFTVPYHFIILSETAKDCTIVQGLTNGSANEKKTIIVTGLEGSVVTYELARILNPLEAGLNYKGIDYSIPLNGYLTEVETAKNVALNAAQIAVSASDSSNASALLAGEKLNEVTQKIADANELYNSSSSYRNIAIQKALEASESADFALTQAQNSEAFAQASALSETNTLTALEAAQLAEQESATNNQESLVNAGSAEVSAQESQASADVSTSQAVIATAQADIATTKASEASLSETNALNSANSANASKDSALNSAAVAQNAIQFSEDNAAQTALDRIATGEDRAQTGLDRTATGQDKAQTALDVTASTEQATIATNKANIATTKAGESATSAEGALVNKDLSVQAKTDSVNASVVSTEQAVIATAQALTATQKANQTALDATATTADRAQTGQDRIQTGQDKTASESAANLSTEQATLSSTARNEAEAAKIAAQNSEDNALTSATESATSATNALASENAAELAYTNTESLLINFFDPAIIALNRRIVADLGIVVIKLRFVQEDLDTIYAL